MPRKTPPRRRRPQLEVMEARTLLSIFTVTRNDDAVDNAGRPAAGTLRDAILEADAEGGNGWIRFDLPAGHTTIVARDLPALTAPDSEIDGTTQAGYTGAPVVRILSPDSLTSPGDGLTGTGLVVAGDSIEIRGLAVSGYDVGIRVQGNWDMIWNNYLGIDPDGDDVRPNNTGLDVTGANDWIGYTGYGNALRGNLISGNLDNGIVLDGAVGNIIAGNSIGTDATGYGARGNGGSGILLTGLSLDNDIGFNSPGATNLISGNGDAGVRFVGDARQNQVLGNWIGTTVTGDGGIGNAFGVADDSGGNFLRGNVISGSLYDGMSVTAAAGDVITGNLIGLTADGAGGLANSRGLVLADSGGNTVGGPSPGDGNTISGNNGPGMVVYGDQATGNLIVGNNMGTDAAGLTAVPNEGDGLNVDSDGNTIADNVLSGNFRYAGLSVNGGPVGNVITGNRIGTTVNGDIANSIMANAVGIWVYGPHNTIGGTGPGESNIISGNLGDGIHLHTTANDNTILNNRIGTMADGATALPNQGNGIADFGARATIAGNLVSGNVGAGIYVDGQAPGSVIRDNTIGTDGNGTAPLGNGWAGIADFGSGTTVVDNLVSGNQGNGIGVWGGATANVLSGNTVGTDATGTRAVPNGWDGINVDGDGNAIVGNLLSGNTASGLALTGGQAGNVVRGNRIGTDASGTAAVPDWFGIWIWGPNNTIGGPDAGNGNLVSGNGGDGIQVNGLGGNTIQGNWVGTDATGIAALGNGNNGLLVRSPNNTITGNLASANGGNGIDVGDHGNVLRGNFFGTGAGGLGGLGNGNSGVIADGPGTVIGGPDAGDGNLISGNQNDGLAIYFADGVLVQGNTIGLDADGARLGNMHNGVVVTTQQNAIRGNTIAANGDNGIWLVTNPDLGGPATFNRVEGNVIGTDAAGDAGLGNGANGVFLSDAPANTIGGTDGLGNVISGNQSNGVLIAGAGSTGNGVFGNLIGTDSTGTAALPNGKDGVQASWGASGNQIGSAWAPAGSILGHAGNLISGNTYAGISFLGADGGGNLVAGNWIGTDAKGTRAVPNGTGVYIESPNNRIGDTTGMSAGNVISGNDHNGIWIAAPSARGTGVYANLIGANANGQPGLGNGVDGIGDQSASDLTIVGNMIADSDRYGIDVESLLAPTTGVRMSRNLIFGNGSLGIDLGGDGVTPNHDGAAPAGVPNGSQNAPVLDAVTSGWQDGPIAIRGSLHAAPGTAYTVEFFANPAADASGHGQGQFWIGSATVTTDATGKASFNLPFFKPLPTGWAVSATATDPAGNTSEFSADVPVTQGTSMSIVSSSPNAVSGQEVTLAAGVVAATAPGNPFTSWGTPTGSIIFYDGGTPLATLPLDSRGGASLTLSTLGLGSHAFTAVYSGDSTFTGNTSVTLAQTVNPLTAANLQVVVNAALATRPAATLAIAPPDTAALDSALAAVAGLSVPAGQTAGIALDLGATSYAHLDADGHYQPISLVAPPGAPLLLNGPALGTATLHDLVMSGGSVTVQGHVQVIGNSPALVVNSGSATVSGGVSLSTATDSPAVVVNGGALAVKESTVQQASTTSSQPAILINGGTLDLGTASSPSDDTIGLSGPGEVIHNNTSTPVPVAGVTFQVNGVAQPEAGLSFTTLVSSANPSVLNQPVTFTAAVRAASGAGTPTGSVMFVDTTTGATLGVAPLSAGVARLTTAGLAVDGHAVVARYGGDGSYLFSRDTLTQTVHYNFGGFQAPLSTGLDYALGRTIPVKFQLTDFAGKPVTTTSAVVSLRVAPVLAGGSLGASFAPASSDGTGLTSGVNQFQFNWSTKGLTGGAYAVVLSLADGTTQVKTVRLRAQGGPAALVSEASGAAALPGAGALHGGNITLALSDPAGSLTAEERARVSDAVSSIDATLAPYGVAITLVDPSAGPADVQLSMADTSAAGGYADGVLGCEADASRVVLVQGWDWYAGSDPRAILPGQYDFETVVVHELGHALGLGHSTDPASVMYPMLAAGTARRALARGDLGVADTDEAPSALHADGRPSSAVPARTGLDHAAVDSALASWTPLPTAGAGRSAGSARSGRPTASGRDGGRQPVRVVIPGAAPGHPGRRAGALTLRPEGRAFGARSRLREDG